jgi:hypothetical protein
LLKFFRRRSGAFLLFWLNFGSSALPESGASDCAKAFPVNSYGCFGAMPLEDNQAIKEATRREDARVVKKAIRELRKIERKEQRKELARISSEYYV